MTCMKRNPDGTIERIEMSRYSDIVSQKREEVTVTPIVDPRPDMVNHPPHYTTGNIEVIDFIDDKQLGFYEGQVIKYVSRAKHKGNELQDLKKAQWYLNRLISNLEKEK